jgi:putative membrane protein
MTPDPDKTAGTASPPAPGDPTSPSRPGDLPAVEDSEGRLQAAMSRVEGVLADVLGLRERPTDRGNADTSTRLSYDRTDLSLDRTYMATERTLQAWIRTTLSMISFGFTLGKLAEVLKDVEVKGPFLTRTLSVTGIAYALVLLGTLGLTAAIVQHGLTLRDLRARGLRGRISIAFVVALVLAVVGSLAFTALVLNM